MADYLGRLEAAKLLDIDTGDEDSLRRELAAAEAHLRAGALLEAAVALYSIVESPRYQGFEDFVAFQNAEYYLAVALARAGASDAALDRALRVMERGPGTLYFSPAQRLAVDIAIDEDRAAEVLERLESLELSEPLPPAAAGERAYLRARAAYDAGDLQAAEGQLAAVSKKSRLYSSAQYLRGVIRTRRGELRGAAESLCEIAYSPADDTYAFVVDDRYFQIKDLARLGLGRLAHEVGDYDDAYYHYFQVPEDSIRLAEALFEAAWSMYQKRELGTARDLAGEFRERFSRSPLSPEAELLAGYVELADCEFDAAQEHYDRVIADLGPLVGEIDRVRRDPDLRRALFDRALERWRAEKAAAGKQVERRDRDALDRIAGLLRLDPEFVRLHEAVAGLRRAAGDAPHVVRAWRQLARRVSTAKVAAVSQEAGGAEQDAADAAMLVDDVRRLQDELSRARAELRRGVRAGILTREAADAEAQRLGALAREIDALAADAARAAEAADADLEDTAPADLGPLLAADLARARDLERDAATLVGELERAATERSQRALDELYRTMRRVVDKAKLGKIDAVIGQKRRLEIEVQDLAAGRFPPELHGQLWEQGLIGDDEEFWPFEGEYWADEYEGWR